jgi:hypothetical protein
LKYSRISAYSIGALMVLGAGGATAQQQPNGVWALSPNTGIAGGGSTNRAKAAPAVTQSRTQPNYPVYYQLAPTVFQTTQYASPFYPGVFQNGFVYANFGRGYERISRSCTTYTNQSASEYTNHTERAPYYWEPPPVYYTPYGIPVPYPQGSRVSYDTYSVSTYNTVSTSCYTTDASGRFIVYR